MPIQPYRRMKTYPCLPIMFVDSILVIPRRLWKTLLITRVKAMNNHSLIHNLQRTPKDWWITKKLLWRNASVINTFRATKVMNICTMPYPTLLCGKHI